MRKNLYIIVFSTLLVSCVTIFNPPPTTVVTVTTTQPALIVFGNDSIETVNNKAALELKRSPNPAVITTISGDLRGQTSFEAQNCRLYRMNAFNLGIGKFIDKNHPSRFEYPRSITINPFDTIPRMIMDDKFPNKGNVFLHLSIPNVNNFIFNPRNQGRKTSTGFLGLSGGVDFFYSDKDFLSLVANGVMDFMLPFPAPIDYSGGQRENFSSVYLNLTNNRKISWFSVGYGLSFAKNLWNFQDLDNHNNTVFEDHYAMGLVITSYYQVGDALNFGIIYRPTFLRFNVEEKFKYEHLISIDFAWKIRIRK